MSGFDRDLDEMATTAAAGCHCCAIFLSNTKLLAGFPFQTLAENHNRVFVVLAEQYLSLCGLWDNTAATPLRHVLQPAKELDSLLDFKAHHEPSTGSPSSFAQARKWLTDCRELHPNCRSRTPGFQPTRLLCIDSESQTVKLRSRVNFPDDIQYATLSHCWGQAIPHCLKKGNMPAFEEGIAFTSLAKTFREAVTICEELSLEYIWIDCFCIIQDSSEDWIAEAPQMQHIYGNSIINIAATDSRDSSAGLFRARNVKVLQPFKLALTDLVGADPGKTVEESIKEVEDLPDGPGAYFYLTDMALCWERFEKAPLNRRSWVLQERLLSPRVLHFDKDQLVWECDSLTACDRFPGPKGIGDLVPGKKRVRASIDKSESLRNMERPIAQELHSIWRPIIKTYSALKITRPTDRLIAMEGIAQRVSQLCDSSYVAGLFTKHMENQLTWSIPASEKEDPRERIPKVAIAPSWSWASYIGEVDMLPQWDSVDTDQSMRRLEDTELRERTLCKIVNKDSLAESWSPLRNFTEMPIEVDCFLAEVHLLDFSEIKCWTDRQYNLFGWSDPDNYDSRIHTRDSLPWEEDRPLDDYWPLFYNGSNAFSKWSGQPGHKVAVHSISDMKSSVGAFGVHFHLDIWDDFRSRRRLYLMPTDDVTRYEPQDLFEKVNVRMIQGLVLERLDDDDNRFRRIGVFTIDVGDREGFWRAAVQTDVADLAKHVVGVEAWPDVDCKAGCYDDFKYDARDDAPQYSIAII